MNKKVIYCGNTNIFHEESTSLKKNPANKLFMNHNANYLRNKWRGKCVIDRDTYTKDPSYKIYKGKENFNSSLLEFKTKCRVECYKELGYRWSVYNFIIK